MSKQNVRQEMREAMERAPGSLVAPLSTEQVSGPKQYEFDVRFLDRVNTQEVHKTNAVTTIINSITAEGWELVQIYSLTEPRNSLVGWAISIGVYGLFRREKRK